MMQGSHCLRTSVRSIRAIRSGFIWVLSLACLGPLEGILADMPSDDYGNAQSSAFRRAMQGGSKIGLAEQAAINALVPEAIHERPYARLRLNMGSYILDTMRNASSGTDQGGTINKTRALSNATGFELAVGYTWSEYVRADLEYCFAKKFNYVANPVLNGVLPTRAISSTFKNSTIFLNGYYDFHNSHRLTPYLSAGAGLSFYNIGTTLTPSPGLTSNQNTRPMKIVFNLGAGLKIRLVGNSYLDMAYRYMRLGQDLQLQNSTFLLKGNSAANVFSVGLLYLF